MTWHFSYAWNCFSILDYRLFEVPFGLQRLYYYFLSSLLRSSELGRSRGPYLSHNMASLGIFHWLRCWVLPFQDFCLAVFHDFYLRAKFLICVVNYLLNLFEMAIFSMQTIEFPYNHCFDFYHLVTEFLSTLGSEQWCSFGSINLPCFLFSYFLQFSDDLLFPPTW